jgi:hypothetical protein
MARGGGKGAKLLAALWVRTIVFTSDNIAIYRAKVKRYYRDLAILSLRSPPLGACCEAERRG